MESSIGNVYFDIMHDEYQETVMSAYPALRTIPESGRFRWDVRPGTVIRFAEAFAPAAKGDVPVDLGQQQGKR
ncbi:hypothetical protein CLCR_05315 [Cladophialophora carrionii]|uniref:Uncharacterized protein n=1 Tax=Cladophialophora carrionii TaxID=86049 RepID=A0A1C1CLR9_9EURO|nr:hypothetical protein CLCR_05315 [Cladophialophora carrionii]